MDGGLRVLTIESGKMSSENDDPDYWLLIATYEPSGHDQIPLEVNRLLLTSLELDWVLNCNSLSL